MIQRADAPQMFNRISAGLAHSIQDYKTDRTPAALSSVFHTAVAYLHFFNALPTDEQSLVLGPLVDHEANAQISQEANRSPGFGMAALVLGGLHTQLNIEPQIIRTGLVEAVEIQSGKSNGQIGKDDLRVVKTQFEHAATIVFPKDSKKVIKKNAEPSLSDELDIRELTISLGAEGDLLEVREKGRPISLSLNKLKLLGRLIESGKQPLTIPELFDLIADEKKRKRRLNRPDEKAQYKYMTAVVSQAISELRAAGFHIDVTKIDGASITNPSVYKLLDPIRTIHETPITRQEDEENRRKITVLALHKALTHKGGFTREFIQELAEMFPRTREGNIIPHKRSIQTIAYAFGRKIEYLTNPKRKEEQFSAEDAVLRKSIIEYLREHSELETVNLLIHHLAIQLGLKKANVTIKPSYGNLPIDQILRTSTGEISHHFKQPKIDRGDLDLLANKGLYMSVIQNTNSIITKIFPIDAKEDEHVFAALTSESGAVELGELSRRIAKAARIKINREFIRELRRSGQFQTLQVTVGDISDKTKLTLADAAYIAVLRRNRKRVNLTSLSNDDLLILKKVIVANLFAQYKTQVKRGS